MIGLRALDVPVIRDEVSAWLLEYGPAVYEGAIRAGKQNMKPTASPNRAAAILAAEEVRRLAHADLYFVSGDMADLAVAAATSLPAFTLMPEDLPSPSGLIVFERPLTTFDEAPWHLGADIPAGELAVTAASWSHWSGGNPDWKLGGVWITFYTDRDSAIASGIKMGMYDQSRAELVRRSSPRLLLDNEVQAPFTPEPVGVSIGGAEPVAQDTAPETGLHRWVGVLKTTWLLMQQPMVDVVATATDRAARRRYERLEKPVPLVRTIRLRRPANPHGSGETDREYHHRWIVRGHWRQQWFPARQVHRPIWIAPHVKGPEDAPLLGGEKVYAWMR